MRFKIKSVRAKIFSLIGISLLPVLFILVSMFTTIKKQSADAVVINLAGRQRMLTQRLVKSTLAYTCGFGEKYLKEARTSYELFDGTLKALMDGGEAIGGDGQPVVLPPTVAPHIRTQLDTVASIWENFKNSVDIILAAGEKHDTPEYRQALSFILNNNMKLLSEMNKAVSMYTQESNAKVDGMKRDMFLGFLLLVVVYTFAGYKINVWVIRRILNMEKRVRSIAENRDLLDVLDVKAEDEDELTGLAGAINELLASFRGALKEVKSSMEVVIKAADRISSATEELAAGAEEQQAQLSEVATSMEEINAMIYQSSQNVQETKNNAAQADTQAREGANQVDESVRRIVEIADIVEKTSKQIQALQSRSREIGEVIAVIDDIADQTNLLALNANIEAARAGDAGRGFAVVADEVRKLAERTIQATAEIEEKIQQIQNDVGDAVQAMEGIRKRARDGREVAESAGNMISGITEAIAQVTEAVSQIATAANEQSSGSEMISKNVESVSMVAKENAQAAQDLAHLAENLNQRMRRLDEIVESFKLE